MPSINLETLETFCDFYIKVVEEIVVILSLYNPMILVGVPLDEKFGLNGPASGFFHEGQAEIVHLMIPDKYKEYFIELAENDDEVQGLLDYFDSLPDLTKEDVEKQIQEQKEFFEKVNNPKREKPSS